MPVQPVERKLAAIFAADIAGYSRLMARDEVGTLARLKLKTAKNHGCASIPHRADGRGAASGEAKMISISVRLIR